jgi:uncharacterized protein (DUF1330 family)
MKCYTVAELDITDPSWIRDYVQHTTMLVERYGGRYLARTGNHERIEGSREPPQFYVLIEWPSREAAAEFYSSEAYRPYRDSRLAGSTGQFMLIAGEDVNGVARIT